MGGRDPHEAHRAATPLELLFDLTFATSFGLAASEVASVLAQGHFLAGLVGFGFASFAICWAWINFSWFSSAYDTYYQVLAARGDFAIETYGAALVDKLCHECRWRHEGLVIHVQC
jgi:low temperature requirement protein LtrA